MDLMLEEMQLVVRGSKVVYRGTLSAALAQPVGGAGGSGTVELSALRPLRPRSSLLACVDGLSVLSQQGRIVPTHAQNLGTSVSVAIQVEGCSQCIHGTCHQKMLPSPHHLPPLLIISPWYAGEAPVLHKLVEFGGQVTWVAYQAQFELFTQEQGWSTQTRCCNWWLACMGQHWISWHT
ncbi:hypothetical protein E2C01_021210 [Portunus trituberculatus]|uniref:Uncharacterized protein n=1 Tax=Portunus trituberculatus TaxID=210409 RepID=A0A5B7E3U1_PORTR|nr:hypothetical protein [Portunus trituberculatus]